MQQKKPIFPNRPNPGRPRPGQDIVVSKQAARFPTVGMTLQSYERNAQNRPRQRFATPAAAKKRGRFSRAMHAITLKRVTATLAIFLLCIGLFLGGKFLYNAHKLFGGSLFGVLSST